MDPALRVAEETLEVEEEESRRRRMTQGERESE
jgi:hypothetical protein